MPVPDPPNAFQKNERLRISPPWSFPWADANPMPTGYSMGMEFAQDNTQASLTIWVDWYSFVHDETIRAEILGYSSREVDGAGTPYIHRQPPSKHQLFPWLYATRIGDVFGAKMIGKDPNPNRDKLSEYQRARITITYTSLPFSVMDDKTLAQFFSNDESKRYTEKLYKANAEYISVDRGFFAFAEGVVNNPKNKKFQLGTGRITVKSDLEWIWYQVPHDSVFDANGIPTNIVGCLGKVNQADIWGFPAGTLLMLPPDIVPINEAVSPRQMNSKDIFGPPRAYNIKYHFKYWDPPLGASATTKGHNTAMYVGDNLFYLIKSISPSGVFQNPLFQSADFSLLFKSI